MSLSHSSSKSKSTPQDLTPAPFAALQGPFADILGQFLNTGGGTPSTTPAPITRNENTLVSQIGATPPGIGGADAVPNIMRSHVGDKAVRTIADTTAGSNPYLKQAIRAAQRPTLQGLTETLTQSLPGRFTQAGQFVQPQGSSAFDRAAAIATRGASDAIGDIATKLSSAAYESDMGRKLEAGTQLQNEALQRGQLGQQGAELKQAITTAQVDNMVKKLQAVALPRLIQQSGLDKGVEAFQSQIDSLLAALGIAGAVTRPVIAQQSSGKSGGTGVSLKS